MKPIPNNTIVYYASSDPKYTGSVGIIASGFISPKSEILTQDVKFAFGTFRHEFTHLHEVKKFTDRQKQSLEKLKLIHPHLFKDNEMRNFNLGECVTHPEHQITGTVISARGANGHYKVLMDDGRDHVFHEDEITLKNNMTELEKAEKRIPMIVKFIQQFLATDLAQQLSPAQQSQLNKPGNYTTWPKLTEKLIKDDLERQAMEFINEKIPKSILLELKPNSVIIDTETTGLDGDAEICEISIIDVFGNVVLDGLIKPSKPVPDAAIAVHGITNEMLEHAPSFDEISDRIIAALKDKDIIVYNAQYDMRLLIQSARLANVSTAMYQDLALKARCSMLAYSSWYGEIGNYNKPKWHKLVAACQQQKIDISSITAHRAKADCLMTLELIKNCKFKYEMDASDAKEDNQTTNNVPESAAQQPETVESNAQPSQENSQTATETSSGAEVVTNPVINKNYVPVVLNLESDVKASAPVIIFDKQIYLDQIDLMPLEDITAKWLKSIKDAAIAIDKRINEPVAAWRAQVDEIIAYAEARIASIKAVRAKEEAARKQTRTARANELITECKAKSDLTPEYLAKIVFKDDYTLVKFTDKKIIEDVEVQIETQRALKKGADDAAALKVANIKNRELLLENLNTKYGANGTYSMFTIEMFSDEQVLAKYEANHQLKLKLEQERLDAEKIKNETKTEAVANASTATMANNMVTSITLETKQRDSTVQADIESSSPVILSKPTGIETVITFKLVVTGRTQADHKRLLPKFLEKINAAVDVGLTPAINAGFGYKFEVVKPTYKYLLEVERDCADDNFSEVVEFDHPATDDDIYAWFKSEDIEFNGKYHRFEYSLIS